MQKVNKLETIVVKLHRMNEQSLIDNAKLADIHITEA